MEDCVILTERLCLRRWIESDKPGFIEMNQDPLVMEYFPALLTPAESIAMIDRINHAFTSKGFGLFAVENRLTNSFMGFTGFSVPSFESFFTPCIEIGWRYKREYWGQGFATEAAEACVLFGWKYPGFTKIVSFTAALNKRSEQVMQRIGMQYTANFNHPVLEKDSPLSNHVLYELDKPAGSA